MQAFALRAPRDLSVELTDRQMAGAWVRIGQLGLLCYLILRASFLLPPANLITAVVVPVCGLAVLLSPRGAVARAPITFAGVLLLIWAALSTRWALDPQFAMFVVRGEILPLVAVVAVICILPIDRIVEALLLFVRVAVAWTAFFTAAFASGRYTLSTDFADAFRIEGWHGTFEGKNGMGMTMVVFLPIVLLLDRNQRIRRITVIAMIALILGSRSATAASGLLTVAATYLWSSRLRDETNRRARSAFIFVSLVLGVVSVLLALGLAPWLVEIYGKDLTLSGRTQIWSASLDGIADEPWLGYGIGGIWVNTGLPTTAALNRAIGFEAAHAHNGTLEMLLELGFIGLALYAALVVGTVRDALRIGDRAPVLRSWILVTLAALLVMSLSESLFLQSWLGYLLMLRIVGMRIVNGAQSQFAVSPPTAGAPVRMAYAPAGGGP
jgi:exopolysaccharide production protein ExoQ